jgi:hypothetical protein
MKKIIDVFLPELINFDLSLAEYSTLMEGKTLSKTKATKLTIIIANKK